MPAFSAAAASLLLPLLLMLGLPALPTASRSVLSASRVRACWEQCGDCRQLVGPAAYDYGACATACTRPDASDDDHCSRFRQRLVVGHRAADCLAGCGRRFRTRLRGGQCSLRVPAFYRQLSREVCRAACREGRLQDAAAMDCEDAEERHKKVFYFVERSKPR